MRDLPSGTVTFLFTDVESSKQPVLTSPPSSRRPSGERGRPRGCSGRPVGLHEDLGSVREAFERELVEATTASVRASLGEDAFAAEFERGRGMSLEDAAACAYAATDS